MRERNHEKGAKYQRYVKYWLDKRPFLGYDSDIFGDAYDVSCKATMIGGISYDISMHLKKDHNTLKILYIECKYRDEVSGTIDAEFRKFLIDSYNAFKCAENDDANAAQFCFISNISPSKLHEFMRSPQNYTKCELEKNNVQIDNDKLLRLNDRIHALILSKTILGVE